MLKVLLTSFIAFTICGCSSIRFFDLKANTIKIKEQQNIEIIELKSKSTVDIHNFCLSINSATDVGNALLAHCAKELLGRDDLSPALKKYALTEYNNTIQNLIKINRSTSSKVQINLAQRNQLLVVNEIIAKEKGLNPITFGELGVAVILRQDNDQQGLNKYYPAEGIYSCKTILLENITIENNLLVVNLALKKERELKIEKNRYELKYSPSAAFLTLIESATIDDYSWLGFTEATQAEKRRGVFSIGKLSEKKIPIVMIHGLNSDPLIWRTLTMALLNDKQLYEKFQIWHVYYPSGPPPFFNAMRIRNELNELLHQLGAKDLSSKAVIIGHSMGGIISRTLSTDSKDTLWNITFTNSYNDLKSETNKLVTDIFIFTPVFDESTVFFLDTPHRGSKVANSVIGSIGSAFVTLPDSFKNIFKHFIQTVGLEKITNLMKPFLIEHGPNSVQVLRPGHPLMNGLLTLPISGESYSIIGSTTRLTCKNYVECNSISDGVVDYSSAYIENSTDTILVKSSHNSFKNPDAISFIIDKLKRKMSLKEL